MFFFPSRSLLAREYFSKSLLPWVHRVNEVSRNAGKLNRFQVHRKNERTFRFDFRHASKSELQSRNPAFSLGKAEDYGNRYGGNISENRAEHTFRPGSTSFSIHAITRARSRAKVSRGYSYKYPRHWRDILEKGSIKMLWVGLYESL